MNSFVCVAGIAIVIGVQYYDATWHGYMFIDMRITKTVKLIMSLVIMLIWHYLYMLHCSFRGFENRCGLNFFCYITIVPTI